MIRVYICPVIGSGVKGDSYRSKAATFGYEYANFIPSNLDGTPKFSWALAVVRSADFTAIEADATCDDLFGGDLPANVDTRPELRALLKNRTVAHGLHRADAAVAGLPAGRVDAVLHDGQ
jgi:hypothetical protein